METGSHSRAKLIAFVGLMDSNLNFAYYGKIYYDYIGNDFSSKFKWRHKLKPKAF